MNVWGVFREIGYGMLFFMTALAGAFLGLTLWGHHPSHGPEEHTQWYVEGAVGGAIIASAWWLWYKYNRLTPGPQPPETTEGIGKVGRR